MLLLKLIHQVCRCRAFSETWWNKYLSKYKHSTFHTPYSLLDLEQSARSMVSMQIASVNITLYEWPAISAVKNKCAIMRTATLVAWRSTMLSVVSCCFIHILTSRRLVSRSLLWTRVRKEYSTRLHNLLFSTSSCVYDIFPFREEFAFQGPILWRRWSVEKIRCSTRTGSRWSRTYEKIFAISIYWCGPLIFCNLCKLSSTFHTINRIALQQTEKKHH